MPRMDSIRLSGHATVSSGISLRELWPQARFINCSDLTTSDVVADSRLVSRHSLFAVIRGTRANGTDYIHEALSRGCAGLIVESPILEFPIAHCVVPDVRKAYAELCAACAHFPARAFRIAGITGTNGKTTVSWMIRELFAARKLPCGVLGTIENFDGVQSQPARLTTPDPREMHRWFSRMKHNSAPFCAMEISSHALDQQRLSGTALAAAVVTNVTQDHFDYHGDWNTYWRAKSRIVEHLSPTGTLILNADDAGSSAMAHMVTGRQRVLRFGLVHQLSNEEKIDETAGLPQIQAEILEESRLGTRFLLRLPCVDLTRAIRGSTVTECRISLVGHHNVSNALAAAAAGITLGLSPREIADGLKSFAGVPGRLERITTREPFEVFVDYAHTDDALQRVIAAVCRFTTGRVICVFGAGGDRDRGKRPKLGLAASNADIAIITSDNPRSENPQTIIREIEAGVDCGRCHVLCEADRRSAIQRAVEMAIAGDTILIAGKGHETEQVLGLESFPFDDRQIARELIAGRNRHHSSGPQACHLSFRAEVLDVATL